MKNSAKILLAIVFLALLICFYISCTSYNYKIRSNRFNVCVNLQVKVLTFFARLEEGSNKLDIMPTNHQEFENTYVSNEYTYSISYPKSWSLEQFVVEDHETIYLTNREIGALIEIGLPQGSICANIGCDYIAGTLYTPFGQAVLTKGFYPKSNFLGFTTGTKVLFYGFYSNMDFSNPGDLPFIKSTFNNETAGIEVANILDTIKLVK